MKIMLGSHSRSPFLKLFARWDSTAKRWRLGRFCYVTGEGKKRRAVKFSWGYKPWCFFDFCKFSSDDIAITFLGVRLHRKRSWGGGGYS